MIFVDETLSSLISPALIYKHYCESNEQNNRDYNQLIVLMEHYLLLSSFDQPKKRSLAVGAAQRSFD